MNSQDPKNRFYSESDIEELKGEIALLTEERNKLLSSLKVQQNTYKDLGQRLSAASSDKEVGAIILEAAQTQIGWDAAYLAIYDPKTDTLSTISEFDTVDGKITEFVDQYSIKKPPGSISRKVLKGFSFFGNRDTIVDNGKPTAPIGSLKQSKSIIITPLINHHESFFGVISIHSYAPDAYGKQEHELFRSLANFCGDALLRSHAETKLRLNEERLNFALSGTNLGVWDWNLETDEVSFTEQFTEMLGYSHEEALLFENFWNHITHKEDLEIVQKNLDDHISGKTPFYEIRRRMRRKDGVWRWMIDRGKVVERDQTGKPIRVTGTVYDITENLEAADQKRNLEVQLQHAQKLESLGLLAGGIAHDFNNLLVAISGNLELALGRVDEKSELYKMLKAAEAGAYQAARLTEQILAYAGKTNFHLESVNFSELVGSMADLLKLSISKKIDLHQDLKLDLPLISGDASQLSQVVMNLITNAADAIGKKEGQISLVTKQVHLKKAPDNHLSINVRFEEGNYICLSVKDTGCGMDSHTRERIFDPFFTTKPTGKGLGLAATMGIIRSHGGVLDIESAPGKGTTFTIYFPVLVKTDSQFNINEESTSGGFPIINPNYHRKDQDPKAIQHKQLEGTVLIIDDEPSVRDVAARMLKQHGLNTLEARNGRAGLEMFMKNKETISLILLDCMMPIMNGFEVYEQVRKMSKMIPILFSSGYNERDSHENIVYDEHVGFIQKPYKKATLIDLVAELIKAN